MKMKQFFLIILTLLTFQAGAQTVRPEIDSLVKKIAEGNVLESEHIGYGGEPSTQYQIFIELRDKATMKELINLLKHKNNVVKGYASWALVDRKYQKLSDILLRFLNKDYKVIAQDGCIEAKEDLANAFYYRVFYQKHYNDLSVEDSLFFRSQLEELDHVILHSRRKTTLFNKALENNNQNPKNYEIIRKLAKKQKKNSAILIALAKYKKQSDIPFFIQQGKNAFSAIAMFPDTAFWEFLMNYQSEERSLDYFSAIASFRNDSALSVLNNIYKDCDSVQVNNLAKALINNYCTSYTDLILEIWEKDAIISHTVIEKLIMDAPEKAASSFAKGLLNGKKYIFISANYFDNGNSIIPMMLDHIFIYNPTLSTELCIENIKRLESFELMELLNIIEKNQMIETIPAILDRLKEKNFAIDIFHLTETVLYFNDSSANAELVKILKARQENWDWGDWSESFKELFEKKQIKFE